MGMKGLENLGPEMDEVMKLMANMSPEDLAKQMQDAMEMFTGDDMMSNMIGHSDEILETLEKTGAVDAEELEKYRNDPEYFEQKMKESAEQMLKGLSDEDIESVRQALLEDGDGG